jgi:hypothetical protein
VVIIKVCIHLLITFSRIKEIMDQKKVLHLKQDMKDERDGEREIRTRETEWISRINFTWIGGHAGSLFQRRKDLASEIFKVACWLVPLTPCIPTTCPNQTHCSSTTLDTCKHAMHGVVVGARSFTHSSSSAITHLGQKLS